MANLANLGQGSEGYSSPQPPPQMKPKRISTSKSWCFTYFNYELANLAKMVKDFEDMGMEYVVGEEVCPETGTPHLQGYISYSKMFRPMERFRHWEFKPHWEKCKGNKRQNFDYCTKEGKFKTNMHMQPKAAEIEVEEPYGWQLDVMDIIKQKPDRRTIHWYWEPNGKVGKSSLVKYLCHKHFAQVCAGKAADMKCQIASLEVPPTIVIFDVPRSNLDYISYTGIEEIKNGCFSSPKYESKMYIMNSPHVIVFANEPPRESKLSEDRWDIVELGDHDPPAPPPTPPPTPTLKRKIDLDDAQCENVWKIIC